MSAAPLPPRSATLLRGAPPLAAWTLAGGRTAPRGPWGWRWQLGWHARWHDRLARQQARLLPAARPQSVPVLVMGFWRSGTTLLHERLAALPGLGAPRTWQCFAPSSFALTGAPRRVAAAERRPMDEGEIDALSPQEDEFALLLQGAPSLYRGFVDPRRLPALADEQLAPASPADGWVAPWLRFLAGVERQGGGARLVLKSPNHVLRREAIERALPDSPQVWIGRDVAALWPSNLRMWRAMFDRYALWPCPEGVLEAFLGRCLDAYGQTLERALAAPPVRPMIWIGHDDLRDAGEASLAAVAHWLGIRDGDPARMAREVVARHPARASRTVATGLPSALAQRAAAIDELHRAADAAWGWRQRPPG